MSDYHLRQMGIVSPARLNDRIWSTTIIGAGGIGSSVAIALLKMGLENVTVYDDDDLEDHNLGNQFLPHSCGGEYFLSRKKVYALQALYKALVQKTSLHIPDALIVYPHRYGLVPHSMAPLSTDFLVISGVDSMASRKDIWGRLKADKSRWYIDGRMGGQQLDIYVVDMNDPQDVQDYGKTLYSDDEAMQEPCTARGIVYTSLFAGAHIANIVKQIAVGPTPPKRLTHVIEHHIVNVVRR